MRATPRGGFALVRPMRCSPRSLWHSGSAVLPPCSGSRVVTHIVALGVVLVAVGIALGALGTIALSRLLTTFLYGVSKVDPIAFAAASAALLAVGAVAAFAPARRAGTVDPALVLREQ